MCGWDRRTVLVDCAGYRVDCAGYRARAAGAGERRAGDEDSEDSGGVEHGDRTPVEARATLGLKDGDRVGFSVGDSAEPSGLPPLVLSAPSRYGRARPGQVPRLHVLRSLNFMSAL